MTCGGASSVSGIGVGVGVRVGLGVRVDVAVGVGVGDTCPHAANIMSIITNKTTRIISLLPHLRESKNHTDDPRPQNKPRRSRYR